MSDADEIQANKNGQPLCSLIPRRGMLQLLAARLNSKLFPESFQAPRPALPGLAFDLTPDLSIL